MQQQFSSPDTLPGLVNALTTYEAAAKERSGLAATLIGEAQKYDREAREIRSEIEQLDKRRHDLTLEVERLESLARNKQNEAENLQGGAQAATAQANDMRQIIAQFAPDALPNGSPQMSTTTGPHDVLVAVPGPAEPPFPQHEASPANGGGNRRNRKEKH